MLANIKGLPFIWHVGSIIWQDSRTRINTSIQVRLFKTMNKHDIIGRSQRSILSPYRPNVLFRPMITTSYSPLLECDYNMHKSNSTYFTDMDISRVHLILALFKDVLALGRTGGKLSLSLGATSCTFKREIKPYEEYETWSRVLSWDDKWLYICSHFVRKVSSSCNSPEEVQKMICASALTKYVFKNGRITVRPEIVLQKAGLIPSISGQIRTAESQTSENVSSGKGVKEPTELSIDGFGSKKDAGGVHWDSAQVEQERRAGLILATSLDNLQALHAVFQSSPASVLGRFRDTW